MQESINNQSMLKVGTILRGIYRIDSYLSSGGFGNTYVATNIEFDERVAIKEFFMKGVTQRDDNQTTVSVSNTENHNSFLEQREKFKKEARRIRQLNNPHIVRVHDLFEENGTSYYVMDYVDGENLSERLKRIGKPMTENEVNQILPQILDALKSIHDAGIWHLDLKPANIMLDKSGNVKLIDFGASKQLNAQKGGATTSTAISYTNGYAPREQMEQNYDKFGPWTDIYALGATLYNLLTNKRPPMPSDIDDDISEDKHNALPFPATTSNDMKQLVVQMMQTNRMKRPQSINEIVFPEKTHKCTHKKQITECKSEDADKMGEETIIIPKKDIANPQEKKEETTEQEADLFYLDDMEETWVNKLKEKITELKYIAFIILLGIGGVLFKVLTTCQGNSSNTQIEVSDSIRAAGIFTKGYSYEVNEEDSIKAFECYKQAAELGNKDALLFAGLYYMDGAIVKQDMVKALDYLSKAATKGVGIAAYYTGLIYYRGYQWDSRLQQNLDKAIYYLEEASNSYHDEDVQYQLGRCYLDNNNHKKAFENFEIAANKNHPAAQWFLYFCYCHGTGTEENQKLAQMWRKRAIENGYEEE